MGHEGYRPKPGYSGPNHGYNGPGAVGHTFDEDFHYGRTQRN
jgi:hypothetical protein